MVSVSHIFSDIKNGVTVAEFQRVIHNVTVRRRARHEQQVAEAIDFLYTWWVNPDNSTARRKMLIDVSLINSMFADLFITVSPMFQNRAVKRKFEESSVTSRSAFFKRNLSRMSDSHWESLAILTFDSWKSHSVEQSVNNKRYQHLENSENIITNTNIDGLFYCHLYSFE